MKILEISWWKWFAVILFIYVLTRGLLLPLKPGIVDLQPSRVASGVHSVIHMTGYNTNYSLDTPRVFFKISNEFLAIADSVVVLSDTRLNIHHKFPPFLPVKQKLVQTSLIVDSELDGAAVIPSKLILSQDSIDLEEGKAAWTLKDSVHFHQKHALRFPYRNILYETIRNTFFHVSLWFAMFSMMLGSLIYSFRVLRTGSKLDDYKAYSLVFVAILFGSMGLATGSIWARFTWDTWWTNDIKLNMAALSMLIYVAYLILRFSIEDPDRRAKVTAAYNVFAVVAIIPLIFVLPRLTDSLHPGNGGNPAFGSEDMDHALRLVFYPSVLAFTLLGFWMAELWQRALLLEEELSD
ncbi:MAG: cytochrome c biogenesis protein CcsA [Saprospiraceae bacterium]|nr:cytochrome c biogenesis protein CcsA [Saprospiraceae bacterium]